MKNENSVSSSLKVFLSDDVAQVTGKLMQDTPVPKTSLGGIGKFLDAMDPIGDVIDMIADVRFDFVVYCAIGLTITVDRPILPLNLRGA